MVRVLVSIVAALSISMGAAGEASAQGQSAQGAGAGAAGGIELELDIGSAAEINRGTVGIIAGSVDGTSMLAASDLAAVLDNGDELRVLPIQGKGSVQAISDLLYLRGVDIALIQRDALEYRRRQYGATIQRRIRYIARLFNEEIHLLARGDIRSLQDLNGQSVNVGVPGSGSDLTASLMFDVLGVSVQPVALDHSLALRELIAGRIAAMVYVGGRPTPLFQHLGGTETGLHLLPVEYVPELIDAYLPAKLTHDDYPGLIAPGDRIDTVAVEAIMAVYNWPPDHPRYQKVARFVEAFFSNLDKMQQPPRHPKWMDVTLSAELPGWDRFAPAQAALERPVAGVDGPSLEAFEAFLLERDLADVSDELRQSLFEEFKKREQRASRTFALVPKAVNNPFFTQAHDGCKEAERRLSGITCLYIGPGEHTEQEQAQIIQDLIDRGIDGIAVSPSNSPLMGSVLKRAKDVGTPVITWDSDLESTAHDLRLAYIGSNNYDIGVSMARVIQQFKPNGGTLCMQTGGAEAANHNERMQGIRDTLAGRTRLDDPPGQRLAGEAGWRELDGCPLVTDDDSTKALRQLSELLASNPGLDVFAATGAFTQWSDQPYRDVVAPHRARLESQELIFVMADTLPMQIAHLRDGLSHAQIGQQPFNMGYRAMQILRDLADGKLVESEVIYTGLDTCLSANLDSCLSSAPQQQLN